MKSDQLKDLVRENAAEIVRLHSRIHETFRYRANGPQRYAEWQSACAEFHERYDGLAFPGGYSTAIDRIASGDLDAMEAAICFLECRPYFFRSGYMFKDIFRKCKKAPLPEELAVRFQVVSDKLAEWKRSKISS